MTAAGPAWASSLGRVLRRHWPLVLVMGIVAYGLWSDALSPRGGAVGKLQGTPAPDFSLPVVAGDGATDGDRISLSDFRGRVVVLDFWASWCGPCRREARELDLAKRQLASTAVSFVGINVESTMPAQAVARAHADFGYSFPSVQANDTTQADYRIQSLPTVVIIDAKGIVRFAGIGMASADELATEINKAFR